MADAIGKNLGDLTLFVSAFTFLPGNEEGRTLIKETIHKVSPSSVIILGLEKLLGYPFACTAE